MIDLKIETPLSLAQAARLVPPTRLDKRVHVSTLVRWIMNGARGVRLEAVRIGGRWVTTREAIERFSAALTDQHATPAIRSSISRPSSADYQRRQERADRELQKAGM